MPTIVADEKARFDRERLLASLAEDNIDGRIFFWPLSLLPMFERRPENVVSYSLYRRAINLPSYHDLSERDMDRVVRCVRRHFENG
jgi:perosamine synthetase